MRRIPRAYWQRFKKSVALVVNDSETRSIEYAGATMTGYLHDDDDVHDARLLCERFGTGIPVQYQ